MAEYVYELTEEEQELDIGSFLSPENALLLGEEIVRKAKGLLNK